MRIRELELYHVGGHHGLVLQGMHDGLNVVYGPNEAGKSTLLAAVRAMLYGRLRSGEPDIELHRGASGTLRVLSEAGTGVTLERALSRKSPVRVFSNGAESQIGDEALYHMLPELRDVDASIFQSVFTFQLQELSDLSEHRQHLAEKLYTVGLVGQASPIQLEANFRDEAKAIYNPDKRARTPLLTQALNRLQQLRRKKSEMENEIEEYLRLQRQVLDWESELNERSTEIQQQVERRAELQKLLELLPMYRDVETKRLRFHEFCDVPTINDKMVTEILQLQHDSRRVQAEYQNLERDIENAEHKLAAMSVDDQILSQLPGLRKLDAQYNRIQTIMQWLETEEQEAAVLQIRNQQLSEQLSGEWSLEAVTNLTFDTAVETAARKLQIDFQGLEGQLQQLETQFRQQQSTAQQRFGTVCELLESDEGVSLTSFSAGEVVTRQEIQSRLKDMLHKLDMWRRQLDADDQRLRRLENLTVQFETASHELTALNIPNGEAMKGRRRSASGHTGSLVAVPVALAFLLGVIVVWTYRLVPAGFTWTLLVITLLLLGWSVWAWKVALVRLASAADRTRVEAAERNQRREQAQKRYKEYQNEFQQVVSAMERIFASRVTDGGFDLQTQKRVLWQLESTLTDERHSWQRADHWYRELAAAVRNWNESQVAKEGLAEQINYVRTELQRLVSTCGQLQGEIGWDDSGRTHQPNPAAWVDELALIREIQDNQRRLQIKSERVSEYKGQVQEWLSALGKWSGTQLEEAVAEASEQLRRWLARAAGAQEKLREQSELQRDIEQQRTRATRIMEEKMRGENRLRTLYEKLNLSSAEEFERLLEQTRQRDQAEADYRESLIALYGWSGGEERYQKMAEHLSVSSQQQLEEELDASQEALQHSRDEERQLQERIVEGRMRLRDWNANDRETLEWELAETGSESAKLASQWAGYKVAEVLLRKARERFEYERQPRILRLAGSLFKQVSGGRYSGLYSRFVHGGQAHIVAMDASGRSWPLASLSRGTREQIYLCLRLSLVKDYANRGIVLPVILDDPMVNFDAARLRPCIQLLEDVAQVCQVIYLTCHATVVDEFQQSALAHNVELNPFKNEVST